jgi:hypothetical protein
VERRAVRGTAAREVVAADHELAAALQDRARRRGLQLRVPLMDLVDSAIGAGDVWGRFSARLAQASVRYAPELLLLGRVAQDADGRWSSDWDMRSADGGPVALGGRFGAPAPHTPPGASGSRGAGTRGLRHADAGPAASTSHGTEAVDPCAPSGLCPIRGRDAAHVARQAVDQAAELLAARFAVRGDLAAIPVTVYGAGTVGDYAALLGHLQSQAYIERVVVDAVRAETLELRLLVRSGSDQLVDLLALGDRFAVDAALSPSLDALPLKLIWRGDG